MKPVERKSLGAAAVLGSLGIALGWMLTLPVAQVSAPGVVPAQAVTLETYGKLPLFFEENRGQTDESVKFLSRGPGYMLFLTPAEQVLRLRSAGATDTLRVSLVNGNEHAETTGEGQRSSIAHYYIGEQAIENVRHYDQVRYAGVYPGIDLVFYGNPQELEYDFVVAPGADPAQLRLRFAGAQDLRLSEGGDVILAMSGGEVVQRKPVVYQNVDGQRRAIDGAFRLDREAMELAFAVGPYNASLPLVIDPVLSYSTYLGDAAADQANGIAIDSAGNAYVTGTTDSATFPGAGADPSPNSDAFVTKFDAVGQLRQSTYFGGNGADTANAIAVDSSGSAHIAGGSDSTNLPLPTALDGDEAGTDAYVAKFSALGVHERTMLLSGNGTDVATGLALDSGGRIYVTGLTNSTEPAVAAQILSRGGDNDPFVAKINSVGTALDGAFHLRTLGGAGADQAGAISIDSTGAVYIAGRTASANFPTVAGSFQTTSAAQGDAFVTKITPDGSALSYSSYLGGNGADRANGLAVDGLGRAYVTGATDSTNFPGAAAGSDAVGTDAFVARLNAGGTALDYSRYLGGGSTDEATAVAVDGANNAYLTGFTLSGDFPTAGDQLDTDLLGFDAFVTKVNPGGTALLYSTYLGGDGDDRGLGIAVDSAGNAFVAGITISPNFNTEQPSQATIGGASDAFVAKVADPGQLRFSSATYSVAEDAAATQVVKVQRVNGASTRVTATCSAVTGVDAGTATSPADFSIPAHNLIWEAGDAGERTCPATIVDDNQVETDETIVLQLAVTSGGATLATPNRATLTIEDNEDSGTLQFTAARFTAMETNAVVNNLVLVSRVGGSDGTLSVTCRVAAVTPATNSSAVAGPGPGQDFTPTDTVLSWADGETISKSCPVTLLEDVSFEVTEQVALSLVLPSGGAQTLGTRTTAVLDILDNDGLSEIRFTAASYTGSEVGGAVTLTVLRDVEGGGIPQDAVSVCVETQQNDPFTVSSATASTGTTTATQGDFTSRRRNLDFSESCRDGDPARVVWAAGDVSSKTVTIPIVNDLANEGTETFTAFLSEPIGNASLGTPNSVNLIIEDNDRAQTGTQSTNAGLITVTIPTAQGSLGSLAAVDEKPLTFDGVVNDANLAFLAGIDVTVLNMVPGATVQITVGPPPGTNTNVILACTPSNCIRIPTSRIAAVGTAGQVAITVKDGEAGFDADGLADGRLSIQFIFVKTLTVVTPGDPVFDEDEGGGALGSGLLLVLGFVALGTRRFNIRRRLH